MVSFTVKMEEKEQGKGTPRTAQNKKERRVASQEAMSAHHVDIVRRASWFDRDGIMGMEESRPTRRTITALVPFAKGRNLGTMGRELQKSRLDGQEDVTA